MYRWVNYSKNASAKEKWVEFDPDNSTIRELFSLEPGRLIWLKTRDNKSFNLDSAYTLSLRDTFSLQLPPEQWTDFGMPYRFSVSIDDILEASGDKSGSLHFYKWKQDSATAVFSLEPLFVPGLPGKDALALLGSDIRPDETYHYAELARFRFVRDKGVPSCELTGSVHSLIAGRYQYIRREGEQADDELLFDLQSEPRGTRDVSAELPGVAQDYAARTAKLRQQSLSAAVPKDPAAAPDLRTLRRLRDLGYL